MTEALNMLELLAASHPCDGQRPKRLPVCSIELLPLFNSRAALDDRAIADLRATLEAGDKLPPLLVLRLGQRTFLVDGHQRLEAHRLYARSKGREVTFSVPVECFQGSPSAAVFASVERNSQHGVRLSTSERTDAAWKLILIGKNSRADITRATKVTRSWLTRMRQVKRLLGAGAASYPAWAQALREATGRGREDLSETSFEGWQQAAADKAADQITRALGLKLASNPEVMARAMGVCLGRRLVDFVREVRHLYREDLLEADAAEEGDF